MLLLGVPQEVAKKGTKGTPLGTPLPDGFLRAVGAGTFAKFLHLGRISARPRWVGWAKLLLLPSPPRVLDAVGRCTNNVYVFLLMLLAARRGVKRKAIACLQ